MRYGGSQGPFSERRGIQICYKQQFKRFSQVKCLREEQKDCITIWSPKFAHSRSFASSRRAFFIFSRAVFRAEPTEPQKTECLEEARNDTTETNHTYCMILIFFTDYFKTRWCVNQYNLRSVYCIQTGNILVLRCDRCGITNVNSVLKRGKTNKQISKN